MQTIQRAAGNTASAITPRFLLRVGGLPINCLDTLRFEQTAQWQNALLSLESLLLRQKSRLVDILHQAVNTYKEEQALRRKLINLKRDVFNMRLPHGTGEARAIAQLLEADERSLLLEWLDLWERYQQQLALGPDILACELEQKRGLLKQLINTPDFRKGVLLSSPILHQAIEGYMASHNLNLNREARTVERSLLEYLFRAACKTSPFSTFTPVSIGIVEDKEEKELPANDIDLQISDGEKRSFTRLNMVILSRLSAQILACEEVRKALLVRITNGWRLRGKTIEYVRRKPVIDTLDLDVSLPLDFIQEHVIQLPVGALLRDLLELLGDGREEKLGDIVAELCAKEAYQQARSTVEAYLQHLLRLGFLIVPALQVDIHHERPLDVYCQNLRLIATPQTDELAQHLGAIASRVDTYALASLAERAEILEEIKHLLQQCCAVLGASQKSALFPRTLLYEDTALAPQLLAIQKENWSQVFASVSELQHILPLFDTRLPQRILTRGYFQARYGVGQTCDDFLSFADSFNLDFLRHLQRDAGDRQVFDDQGNFKGHPNYFHQPELEQLNAGRLKVAEYIREAYQALPAGSTELVLEEDFTHSLARFVPDQDLLSHSFFAQFARINSSPLLILNQIYSGLTLMFSRFAYCFTRDERIAMLTTLREALERLQPAHAVFAELKGGYDATNLNLHPAITPYELVCPGELSTRAPEEQIPMEDLFIKDDVASGQLRLYSKRLGKEVIPLYLGFLTPRALPEVQQILLNFSHLTISPLNLWSGTKIASEDSPVVFYPRLRYKQVVLQRATWKVAANHLPRRENGQSDADFFLAVSRWRKELGLPTKVFIAPDSIASSTAADDAKAEAYQSYKPLCVDFENYFSILLLEATVRKTNSSFLITEMLPMPEHLWFRHDNQAYVSEFVFEVSQIRRASHGEKLD